MRVHATIFDAVSGGVPRAGCRALHPTPSLSSPGAQTAGASCTESLGQGGPPAVIQPGTWAIGGAFRVFPFCEMSCCFVFGDFAFP